MGRRKAGIRIAAILAALLVLVSIGGCSMFGMDNKSKMMQYMEEKYGEEFAFVDIGTQMWNASYIEMIVSSEKFPGERINVHIDRKSKEISDNYLFYLRKAEVDDLVEGYIENIYGGCRVFSSGVMNLFTFEEGPSLSLDAYVKLLGEKGVDYGIFVMDSDADKETDAAAFIEKLRKKGFYPSFAIFYVSAESLTSMTELDSYDGTWIDAHTTAEAWFVLDREGNISYEEWR